MGDYPYVRLLRVHTNPDEYRNPFKGIVRTPSIASGRGYCLQTAYPESRRQGHFTRKPANPPKLRDREGL